MHKTLLGAGGAIVLLLGAFSAGASAAPTPVDGDHFGRSGLTYVSQQCTDYTVHPATEPKVLILDSPTVGVDVGARAGIYRIVRELAAQGLAILLISDEVSEVHFNADRILHMAAGRIVAEYDPRETTLTELEEAVYA